MSATRQLPRILRIGAGASQALASGSPANNPRLPAHAHIVALYRRVWASETYNGRRH